MQGFFSFFLPKLYFFSYNFESRIFLSIYCASSLLVSTILLIKIYATNVATELERSENEVSVTQNHSSQQYLATAATEMKHSVIEVSWLTYIQNIKLACKHNFIDKNICDECRDRVGTK